MARGSEPASKVETCEDLRGFRFGSAVVRTAAWYEQGSYKGSVAALANLPAFCRAVVTASPEPGSNITIEVLLPPEDVWNSKLLATGNVNFGAEIFANSTITYSSPLLAVNRHYAAASTDMGTYPGPNTPNQYDAGIGHPEMVKDWGYRATHEMSLAAKALIEKYYSRRLSRSYFIGCSTGGQQALTEAQRYPEDFDGLIAGDPANNRTHVHASFLQRFQKAQTAAPLFSKEKETLISKAVLAACAGRDGGAPGDQYLNNPAECDFQPSRLICPPDQKGDSCLTRAEVKVLETMYDGTRNPRTHELIYPGWAKGSESSIISGLEHAATPTKTEPLDGIFRWVFGPQWDARTFDFDKDMERTDAEIGPIVNSVSADLSAFTKRGGKLIMFQGWTDTAVNPYDSIIYFDRINGVDQPSDAQKLLASSSSFSRLFMAPGMGHCHGGPGADSFGQNEMPDGPPNPGRDIVAALDVWVEKGVAPQQLTAVKLGTDRKPEFERPVCSYPKVAKYNGSGDPKLASSFTCSEAPTGKIEFPAATYLK